MIWVWGNYLLYFYTLLYFYAVFIHSVALARWNDNIANNSHYAVLFYAIISFTF